MGVFLTLNVYGLERIRWVDNPTNSRHHRWRLLCGLLIANFLVANFWLAPVNALRADLTTGNIYSISETTRNYLKQLKEPLLIRGYFSAQTHPLLAPLVPRIRDLLREYGVAGGDKIRVEFIDPQEHPDLEQEAGQKYGIRPVPFQTESKYQASVTNSYFDVLIQYGDQFETLGFRDLIEVKASGERELEVELRNPEYDITRAIKKVLYSYQGAGDLFSDIGKPVQFIGYMSSDSRLPEELVQLKGQLQPILAEMEKKGKGLFSSELIDPDGGGGVMAKSLTDKYGFQPMTASLFDNQTFWFYMTLKSGEQVVEVPLPEDLTKESLRRSLSAGIKRFATGFTKTVALTTPKATPPMPQFGMQGGGPQFEILHELLAKDHGVISADLTSGRVPDETDLLMVVAPESIDEKQLFAMDQFLMEGGTVVLATSPFAIGLEQQLNVSKQSSGLADWLKFHGIAIEEEMVLDPQNSAFPVPVERKVGGFSIQETQLVNYPYFVDIRPDGMNQESGLLSGLNQLTMNWASPISVDMDKNKERQVTRLLESSEESWLSGSTDIQPNFSTYGELGFAPGSKTGKQLLGVVVEGRFTSYFAGKPSPLRLDKENPLDQQEGADNGQEKEAKPQIIHRQIDKSPESARIVLFSSNSFLNDQILGIGSSVMQSSYLGPVQLVANSVDWSLEDRGLLSIRGRGHFSRTLLPMTRDIRFFWEYLNYGLALLGLALVWLVRRSMRKRTKQHYLALLQ
jgi:ABC-2 type transport system permease protein